MQGQHETIRFLCSCESIWHRRFSALHRRGQWHIASHLCTRGRAGAAVGELAGMVKQLFLLDDATVRERMAEMAELGLCTLDPPDGALSARSIVIPTESMLQQFDEYLLELATALQTTANALDADFHITTLHRLDRGSRQTLLQAVECCRNDTIAALERIFESTGLSRARRLDARRHLLSGSHWLLLLEALAHRYGINTTPADEEGILADQMAATLLSLTRQNFQTTRDHIAYLMQLGLLDRRPGRALRVALSEPAGRHFDCALADAATELPRIARRLPEQTEAERTAISRPAVLPTPSFPIHALLVRSPDGPDREVAIGAQPLVIGRAPGSGIVLGAIEVSRAHCRITLADDRVVATDLNSTNGTLINGQRMTAPTALTPDSVLQIGPYRLEYRRRCADPESTMRPIAPRGKVAAGQSHRNGSV